MNWFLKSGDTLARLVRTLVEVLLAWLLANIGDITTLFRVDANIKVLLVSLFTVLLTAVIGFISDNKEENHESE